MLYIPNKKAGNNATTTTIITLLRSTQSLMWLPFDATVFGTKAKDSNASNVECKKPNLPPFSKDGFILSINFLNPIILLLLSHFFNHHIDSSRNNRLYFDFRGADIFTKGKILFNHLVYTEFLHFFNIFSKNCL